MAFASNSERLALNTMDFSLEYVVRFEKNGRQSELIVDDIEHALNVQKHWIDNSADYVEIFRVLHDGSLNPTIGAYRKDV